MSAYKDPRDKATWRYRKTVRLPDGTTIRISGKPNVNTKAAALAAEREHVERVLAEFHVEKYAPGALTKAPVPTLTDWFRGGVTSDDEDYRGRYWTEHVIGEKGNRGSTKEQKRQLFEHHLEPTLGHLRLDEIDLGVVNAFRAELTTRLSYRKTPLSPKTIVNILIALTNALRYAEQVRIIERMPLVRIRNVPQAEVEALNFDEYGRMLGAALHEGEPWSTAVLIAGECGLRIGELLALQWSDVDLVARTMTIARQIRRSVEGPTKGGKSRTLPMTPRLVEHLRNLPRIRTGRVVTDAASVPMTEGTAKHGIYRVARVASLPERSWHALRHTFATHAALLGVNPMRLQQWLGHAAFTMTMRYVHFAEVHAWPIPDSTLIAGIELTDPTKRVVVQLGSRPTITPTRRLDRPTWRANGLTTARDRAANSWNVGAFSSAGAVADFVPS